MGSKQLHAWLNIIAFLIKFSCMFRFMVWILGLGLGFRVQGLGSGFGIVGLDLCVESSCIFSFRVQVQDLGFRIQGLGFMVRSMVQGWGLVLWVQIYGSKVVACLDVLSCMFGFIVLIQNLGFMGRVSFQGYGLGFRVLGQGFRVQGYGLGLCVFI